MLGILSDDDVLREYQLKDVIRYNNRQRINEESVAEHTCFVSMFCLKIMSKIEVPIEIQHEVLVLAALHDAAESITSDIPHDVKDMFPELESALWKVEELFYKRNWPAYYEIVRHPSKLAYAIMKLADSYSVYQWCLNERKCGNSHEYIEHVFVDSRRRIESYTKQVNAIVKMEAGE